MLGILEILITLLVIGIIPLIAIIDILSHDFSGSNKFMWLILVVVLPLVGSILYFIIGRNQQIKTPK